MTLRQIEALDRDTLTPEQVASCLSCDPHYIRLEARGNPARLGFPVICVGTRVKIPRLAFIQFMRGDTKGAPA